MKNRAEYIGRVVLLAAVYVVVARLGLKMDAVSGFATLVWAPTGISLAALLISGQHLWPGIALGAVIVNVWTGAPVPVACGIALGNTLEAVVGAYALRRIPGFQLSRVQDRKRRDSGLSPKEGAWPHMPSREQHAWCLGRKASSSLAT